MRSIPKVPGGVIEFGRVGVAPTMKYFRELHAGYADWQHTSAFSATPHKIIKEVTHKMVRNSSTEDNFYYREFNQINGFYCRRYIRLNFVP